MDYNVHIKKTVLILITLFFITLTTDAQEFKFETETIDYGNVVQGSDDKRICKFTNIGNAPLIIKQVKSTCGCLMGKGPEAPIMPGEKGEIEVRYDTGRIGRFSKYIIIYSNAKEEVKNLKVKGNVISKE